MERKNTRKSTDSPSSLTAIGRALTNRRRRVRNLYIFVACSCLCWTTIVFLCWIIVDRSFNVWPWLEVPLYPSLATLVALQFALTRLVAQIRETIVAATYEIDASMLGPLCECVNLWEIGESSNEIQLLIARLIEPVSSKADLSISDRQREMLYKSLLIPAPKVSTKYIVSVISLIDRVADEQALPQVARLVDCCAKGEAWDVVREFAAQTEKTLRAKIARGQEDTLLRPASDAGQVLLRPLAESCGDDVKRLLRPSIASNGMPGNRETDEACPGGPETAKHEHPDECG